MIRSATSFVSRRQAHTLAVKYVHAPTAPVSDSGIPTTQVRTIGDHEKKWDFWSTTDAFHHLPPAYGPCHVPFGASWILKNGQQLNHGWHFVLPNTLKAVKTPDPIVVGMVTRDVALPNGQEVNAYLVAVFNLTDAVKSANYVCAKTGKPDSERAAALVLRAELESQIPGVCPEGVVDAASADALKASLVAIMKTKETEFGLELMDVEVRGITPVEFNLREKVRAYHTPGQEPDSAGHGLSADYWADVLTPPMFEKFRYGSNRQLKTAAAVSLEWSIPSPPDFHHFNMLPRMTAADDEPEAVAKKH